MSFFNPRSFFNQGTSPNRGWHRGCLRGFALRGFALRGFALSGLALSGFALGGLALGAVSGSAQAAELTIGFYGDAAGDAWLGAEQGIEENNAQGEFLNLHYTLAHLEADELAPASVTAIVVAGDADTVRRVARNHPDTPVINVISTSTGLRADCVPNLFHTIPSERMKEDALRQWEAKNPGTPVKPQAWSALQKKYAAGQLNSRFEAAHQRKMNDLSWSGWAATKLVGDLIARHQPMQGSELIDTLHMDTNFDGQHGVNMTFRPTGQLTQPIWLVDSSGKVVGEAPVRGVVDPTDLSTLGLTECPK